MKLEGFIQLVKEATTDEQIVGLVGMAREYGAPGLSELSKLALYGNAAAASNALRIVIDGVLTSRPVARDMVCGTLRRPETALHELVLPEMIDLARNGVPAAVVGLQAYVAQGEAQTARYLAALMTIPAQWRKSPHLPRVKMAVAS